jgi:hypothetical protein
MYRDKKEFGGSPFDPWNREIYRNDMFAPWNDPMKRDDPFACWNNPFGEGRYRDEVNEKYGR